MNAYVLILQAAMFNSVCNFIYLIFTFSSGVFPIISCSFNLSSSIPFSYQDGSVASKYLKILKASSYFLKALSNFLKLKSEFASLFKISNEKYFM